MTRRNVVRTRLTLALVATLAGALAVVGGCETAGYRSSPTTRAAAQHQQAGGIAARQSLAGPHTLAPSSGLSAPGPGSEVWVIAKPQEESSGRPTPIAVSQDSFNLVDLLGAFGGDTFAGSVDLRRLVSPSGGMVGVDRSVPDEPRYIHVPLEHTDVDADIAAYIGTVNVTQQFHNPYDGKIEAVYVFPLPDDAAVSDFIMTIGERRIRGVVREREEAERIYEEAKRQGYNAALLQQERPNIFTQKVANIEPGRRIDVDITYFHTLTYDDGWYEFAFPMVVGPRFNPPGSSDPVRALPRGAGGASTSGTDITYLAPNERSGHDISLEVTIDAGVAIEEIECSTHEIETIAENSTQTTVRLANAETIPNRDFVLRYRVAGERIKTAVLTHRDPARENEPGHFTMMIYPPRSLRGLEREPVEMIFVLDCSGSMSGEPLALAKQAVERGLQRLRPGDSFQIIRFSESASPLSTHPLEATRANIDRGLRYVQSLSSGGGTMMIEGIKAALDAPRESIERDRYVVFLTDGYIGNEAEILGAMRRRIINAAGLRPGGTGLRTVPDGSESRPTRRRPTSTGETRVFSFGIGSSPNRFLLERMASLGEGVVAYVGLNDSAAEVMDRFVDRIAHPVLENITIDFGGMQASDVFPSRVPDLFPGRPIVLAGRFRGRFRGDGGVATVRIDGAVGSREMTIPIEVNLDAASHANEAIAKVWARTKIMQLMNEQMIAAGGGEAPRHVADEVRGAVLAVALEYGLASAYTSFVAVDSARRTEGDHGTTVNVPVPVPDGVRYDTSVGR